ncbi:hypothetical protein BGW39_005533 [Mortierella sp. 14UC]|nr:hypothetical protein BGW39_005533 [Mortierella sp. 14UC]
MSHLIDPCLRATKIAHGIRRGIDGISPLSGLVPELRILIQEQKNVLTSLKRTAFEKEEAAKHLAIYAKTEGPDLADTLSKLSLLIRKAADLERVYADSLAQSRELFKEVRAAEDNNYSVRKRKMDLESKLATSGSSSTLTAIVSTTGTSTALVKAGGTTPPPPGPELHPEMNLLRKETMTVENELEDLKRKKIKRATAQQLDALEKWGKEMIVVAHYGREIMDQLDDTPTEAGQYADDRYGKYDGAAKTAYSLKACLDTLKDWPSNAPIVQMHEVDMSDFPKDTKGAIDAMMHDLAVKTGSDWYDLQQPFPSSSTTSSSKQRPSQHTRNSSTSSTSSTIRSARDSMSSGVTTVTYVDGVPMVQVINEIPPTPEHENRPILDSAATTGTSTTTGNTTAQEPIPVFVVSQSLPETAAATVAEPGVATVTPGVTTPTTAPASPIVAAANTSSPLPKPMPTPAVVEQSPFIPHSTYTPSTTYQPGHDHTLITYGQGTPPVASRPRPISGDRFAHGAGHAGGFHAPHPLMMQHQPLQQQYPPGPSPSPPGGQHIPMSMPVPVHNMPLPMQMPVPHIPGSPDPHYPYSNDFGSPGQPGGNKRHSNPISVSFPLRQQPGSPDPASLSITSSASPSHSRSPSPRPQAQGPRGPQAILPPTEPGFRVPVGVDEDEEEDEELTSTSAPGGRRPQPRQQQWHPQAVVYDGPPPDYAEAAMNPPAEKFDDKKKR